MVRSPTARRDSVQEFAASRLTTPDGGQGHPMIWLLGLLAWVALSLLAAPVVGRSLALDGRPPRRRRHLTFHRVPHRLQ